MRCCKKWVWPSLLCAGVAALLVLGQRSERALAGEDKGAQPGRYQAVAAGGTVILLDTTTGRTWRAQMGGFGPVMPPFPGGAPGMMGGGDSVWVPMTRFDKMEDYDKWRREHEGKLFRDKGPMPVPMPIPIPPPPFKEKATVPPRPPVDKVPD